MTSAETLTFKAADTERYKIDVGKLQAARGTTSEVDHEGSYRPWNQRFVDPVTPLDLP